MTTTLLAITVLVLCVLNLLAKRAVNHYRQRLDELEKRHDHD